MKCKGVVGPHLGNAFQHLIALFGFEDAPPLTVHPPPALPHQLVISTPVLVQESLGNLSQGEDQGRSIRTEIIPEVNENVLGKNLLLG